MSRSRLLCTSLASAAWLCALAAPAHAEGWQWLPALTDPAFKAQPSLALTGNRLQPGTGSDTNAWGLDFNMNCGLVQSPDRRIRTHVNISHANEHGVEINAFELSPRYTAPIAGVAGLSVGAGPSLGLFKVDNGQTQHTLGGIGAALGLNFRAGALYTGVDLRWHATTSRGGTDLDPLTWGAKVGVNF